MAQLAVRVLAAKPGLTNRELAREIAGRGGPTLSRHDLNVILYRGSPKTFKAVRIESGPPRWYAAREDSSARDPEEPLILSRSGKFAR